MVSIRRHLGFAGRCSYFGKSESAVGTTLHDPGAAAAVSLLWKVVCKLSWVVETWRCECRHAKAAVIKLRLVLKSRATSSDSIQVPNSESIQNPQQTGPVYTLDVASPSYPEAVDIAFNSIRHGGGLSPSGLDLSSRAPDPQLYGWLSKLWSFLGSLIQDGTSI